MRCEGDCGNYSIYSISAEASNGSRGSTTHNNKMGTLETNVHTESELLNIGKNNGEYFYSSTNASSLTFQSNEINEKETVPTHSTVESEQPDQVHQKSFKSQKNAILKSNKTTTISTQTPSMTDSY